MSETATKVVERTMQDEQFLNLFQRNPDAALEEYDLAEHEEKALKSGKESRIRDVIDDALAAAVLVVVVNN
ncbi:hypothetical protein [Haladaptatus paucihalophilus]|uniref:Uncharacterized protein n=2 Tax=Haladaptatus paucihalophilus TaxID=367189 RepID=A0A1M6NU92_HALPU|nr:hypothetical protein [Haladaptatus paucihalophilus]SHJ99283.1 hypothetical protein SAMN05444342_0200 [Haladaptatus paucihalophilus DX253]